MIGNDGEIPWRLPGEQAQFKALTMGHVLVMGRLTYDSIGRPLPGRRTVVDHPPAGLAAGRRPASRRASSPTSVEAALQLAAELDPQVFVVGGGEIYAATLPLADAMVVTWVDAEPEGDAYFPEFDPADWRVTSAKHEHAGYSVVHYQRDSEVRWKNS